MDTKSLDLQRDKALRRIRKCRGLVTRCYPEHREYKLLVLDWMESWVNRYKWLPGSFNQMLLGWSSEKYNRSDTGIFDSNPWCLETGKRYSTVGYQAFRSARDSY